MRPNSVLQADISGCSCICKWR